MAGKKFQLLSPANEKWIFIGVLLINIVFICLLRFLPSMDGPSHLYNSNILLSLFKGSDSLTDFYSINSIIIPNWFSHFLLAIFRTFLPAWIAEKLLIIIYITGLSWSFRLLIKQLNPENLAFSIFIFPFAYSLLFHMGFYNYCLSFVFYFFALYYWIKTRKKYSILRFIFLLLLMVLTYYSNILIFLFLGLTIGIFVIATTLSEYSQKKDLRSCCMSAFREFSLIFISSLPGIILGTLFFLNFKLASDFHKPDSKEILKWLKDLRPLIVYNYEFEKIFTQLILFLLILLLFISFIYSYLRKSFSGLKNLHLNDYLLIPVLFALLALFIVPPAGFAGMMSDRLALMFFITFIIFVLSKKFPEKVKYIFIPVILLIHFSLLFYHFNAALKKLSKNAHQIEQTAGRIPSGSIVLPMDMTGNWLEAHFSNYLGIEKNIIILENYEATMGWFPIKWNKEKIPNILVGNKSKVSGNSWKTNLNAPVTRQVDFIFLYGHTKMLKEQNWQELNDILLNNFSLVYSSEDEYIKLFQRKY